MITFYKKYLVSKLSAFKITFLLSNTERSLTSRKLALFTNYLKAYMSIKIGYVKLDFGYDRLGLVRLGLFSLYMVIQVTLSNLLELIEKNIEL